MGTSQKRIGATQGITTDSTSASLLQIIDSSDSTSPRTDTEIDTGRWIVSPKAEPILRELGERGDIIKTMHRVLEREGKAQDRHPSPYVLHREKAMERIAGRVLDKGLGSDEMGERVRLVIDGVDGRVHHVELDASRAEEIGRGMIIAAGSAPSGSRAADRNIMDIAGEEGNYRPSAHLERARRHRTHRR
jgi:type IV secretory pathway VirD2 relaxase